MALLVWLLSYVKVEIFRGECTLPTQDWLAGCRVKSKYFIKPDNNGEPLIVLNHLPLYKQEVVGGLLYQDYLRNHR